jgi:hypothetical protein
MATESTGGQLYDFMYPKFLLKDLFNIVIDEDTYVERAYNIWRDIGNIATAIHAFEFEIDESKIVNLPCNLEFIEAVSQGSWEEDSEFKDVIVYHADWSINPNAFLADSMVRNPSRIDLNGQDSRLKAVGSFIPYNLKGSTGNYSLEFNEEQIGMRGVCIYRGVCVDDQGNPVLTRKEAEAIAYKSAFIETQRNFFMGDPTAGSKLTYISNEAGRKMAAAKIPEYLSQNFWNRLLSAHTRHDRKVYWSSYKTLQ